MLLNNYCKLFYGKNNRNEKFSKVSSPSKLICNTSINLDSSMHETVKSLVDMISNDNTTADKILKHEHIKIKSEQNYPIIQISYNSPLQICKKL